MIAIGVAHRSSKIRVQEALVACTNQALKGNATWFTRFFRAAEFITRAPVDGKLTWISAGDGEKIFAYLRWTGVMKLISWDEMHGQFNMADGWAKMQVPADLSNKFATRWDLLTKKPVAREFDLHAMVLRLIRQAEKNGKTRADVLSEVRQAAKA